MASSSRASTKRIALDRYLAAARADIARLSDNEVDDFARRLAEVVSPLAGRDCECDSHDPVDQLIYWALGTLIVEAVGELETRDGQVLADEVERWLAEQG